MENVWDRGVCTRVTKTKRDPEPCFGPCLVPACAPTCKQLVLDVLESGTVETASSKLPSGAKVATEKERLASEQGDQLKPHGSHRLVTSEPTQGVHFVVCATCNARTKRDLECFDGSPGQCQSSLLDRGPVGRIAGGLAPNARRNPSDLIAHPPARAPADALKLGNWMREASGPSNVTLLDSRFGSIRKIKVELSIIWEL